MYNFACCLLSNLALLAAVHVVCWFVHAMRPDLSIPAERVFVGMIAIAFVFDAALTFLVFADATGPWQRYHPVSAFFARAVAYALAVTVAFVHGRRAAAKRAAREQGKSGKKSGKDSALVIETSPYSKSTLPM